MSETNLMKAGVAALAAYLEVVKADRELVEFTAALAGLKKSANEITAALAQSEDAYQDKELAEALIDTTAKAREAKADVEMSASALQEQLDPLRLAIKKYSRELVKAGVPPLRTTRDLYISFLSARSSGLMGAAKGANACRFGDAWARPSGETFTHAGREFAFEEVTIKLSAKVFE